MSIPDSTFAIAVLIALAVPGVVFSAIRISILGYFGEDKDLESRISQAVLVSVIIDTIYLIVGGSTVLRGVRFDPATSQVAITDPTTVGWSILLFAVLLPSVAAVLTSLPRLFVWIPTGRGGTNKKLRLRYRVSPIATAWDAAAQETSNTFVRILKADGRWVAGLYAGESAIGVTPEPRDMYLETQYLISLKGVIGAKIPGTRGVWVAIEDGDVVEWLDIPTK